MENDADKENLKPKEKKAINREKAILQTIQNKRFDLFADYLAKNFCRVSSQGILNKKEEVEATKQVDLKSFSLSSIKVLFPDDDVSIISYKAKVEAFIEGQDVSGVFYASSTWVKDDGKWLNLHHTFAREEKLLSGFSG